MSTELVPSVSIENVVQKRDAVAERIREAHRLFREARELAKDSFGVAAGGRIDYRVSLDVRYSSRSFEADDGADLLIRKIDGAAWEALLDMSGLRTFLDAKARREWDEAIEKDEAPPLTVKNIEATFKALYDARGDMFERGVLEVFRRLSWDYKTNTPVKFGKRIILRHIVDRVTVKGDWKWAGPSYEGCNELDDLVRVLCVLDDKPEPDHRNGTRERLRAAGFPQAGVVELDYFTIRGYRNANGHLTFTRLDLVDKMNRILTKHHPNALPPAR